MKKLSILLLLFFLSFQIKAQEESQTEKKGFLIVSAGKNYEAMKKIASQVATKLDFKLDLRDLEYNKTEGLSFPKDTCEAHGFEFPFYLPRGRWDDGNYVSIEYTNAYEGFTPKLYILIVASYSKNSPKLKETLKTVKKQYKYAYIKYADIYQGCIH